MHPPTPQECPWLTLGNRWIDFATGNAAGLFADDIHPNDTGPRI